MSSITYIGLDVHTTNYTICSFNGYLGLIPGEHSSAEKTNRLGITKTGNKLLRRLLVEAAQHCGRGAVGRKSVSLKKKQGIYSVAPSVISNEVRNPFLFA